MADDEDNEEVIKMVDNLVETTLPKNAQRGSKPRCHRITQGTADIVAARLSLLISDLGTVSERDTWMPKGFENIAEAELHRHQIFTDRDIRKIVKDWWFAQTDAQSKTPNFDIVSTCTIDGRVGVLLVEAKAHVDELQNEKKGKVLNKAASKNSHKNHERIGESISNANQALIDETNLPWNISRDSNYQMSNRFAWAWKLLELGIPVILLYLGFLEANDMNKGANGRPQEILKDHQTWKNMVLDHGKRIVPVEVWNSKLNIHGQSFIPLIRSVEIPFNEPINEFVVYK
jgi:hypothetical protein